MCHLIFVELWSWLAHFFPKLQAACFTSRRTTLNTVSIPKIMRPSSEGTHVQGEAEGIEAVSTKSTISNVSTSSTISNISIISSISDLSMTSNDCLHFQRSPDLQQCLEQKLFYLWSNTSLTELVIIACYGFQHLSLCFTSRSFTESMLWNWRETHRLLQHFLHIIGWGLMHEVYHVQLWRSGGTGSRVDGASQLQCPSSWSSSWA